MPLGTTLLNTEYTLPDPCPALIPLTTHQSAGAAQSFTFINTSTFPLESSDKLTTVDIFSSVDSNEQGTFTRPHFEL